MFCLSFAQITVKNINEVTRLNISSFIIVASSVALPPQTISDGTTPSNKSIWKMINNEIIITVILPASLKLIRFFNQNFLNLRYYSHYYSAFYILLNQSFFILTSSTCSTVTPKFNSLSFSAKSFPSIKSIGIAPSR